MSTNSQAPCLAILGTGSDVGKSIITTALCRIGAARGIRVAPYKSQNMSNNSGVTPEGLEMGRAQIVQAEAARIPPHVDMNPILLKPTCEIGSQVVIHGTAQANNTAREYHARKDELFKTACASLDRLRSAHDLIIMEGAGSCAEINLLDNDIVNCRMAAYAAAPAILVGDIHRGGIFAQLTGTLACLPEHFRNQIAGFIINRFRGDLSLFRDGTDWIEQNAGKPVYGVLPAYSHFRIEAEDSVVIENPDRDVGNQTNQPAIAVIRTPLISNFTDFDPLAEIAGLDLIFIEKVRDLSSFHAVILPGSKNTRHDLAWLQQTGWAAALREYADSGGHILGICGGYQILGRAIHDPEGLEGSAGSTTGLNLLPVETVIESPKTTTRTSFSWNEAQGEGYEIHMGKTTGNREVTLFTVQSRNGRSTQDKEGCRGSNDRIIGTYIHGLFDMPAITKIWLASIGLEQIELSERHGPAARDRGYDLLAEHVNKHIRVDDIFDLVGM